MWDSTMLKASTHLVVARVQCTVTTIIPLTDSAADGTVHVFSPAGKTVGHITTTGPEISGMAMGRYV